MHAAPTSTILLAEDDPDILALVRLRLERWGYAVLAATNGDEALELAFGQHVDLALLDVQMPGLTGVEVTQQLRADERTREIPVILLTASVQEREVVIGLGAGASAYVKKPFDPNDLRARIERALGGDLAA
jgi:two-component system phosphate regulon response regulator PhoB